MIDLPRDDQGLPIVTICAICEEEWEDGDRTVQLIEMEKEITDKAVNTYPVYQEWPEVHKECLGEL